MSKDTARYEVSEAEHKAVTAGVKFTKSERKEIEEAFNTIHRVIERAEEL